MTIAHAKKKKAGRTPKSTTVVVSASSRPSRQKRSKPRRSGSGPIDLFVRSAKNPFNYSPPTLGFGSLTALSSMSGYWRGLISIGSTATSFVNVLAPSILTGGTNPFGDTLGYSGYLYAANSLTADESLASLSAYSRAQVSNYSLLSSSLYSFTPTTGGMRLTINYPMTSAPGMIFAGRINCSQAAMKSFTINQLINLPSMHPVLLDGGGTDVVEVRYLPEDVSDLVLEPYNYAPTNSSIQTQLVIVGILWTPGSFRTYADTIVHYDCTSDLDTGISMPSVGSAMPIEHLARYTAAIKPVSSEVDVIAEDSAYNRLHLRNSNSRSLRTGHESATVPGSLGASAASSSMVDEVFEYVSSSIPSSSTVAGMAAAAASGALSRAMHERIHGRG